VGINSPPCPPFTARVVIFQIPQVGALVWIQCGGQFAALAAFHSQGFFSQIPQVGALMWIQCGGQFAALPAFHGQGCFCPNSSSWCPARPARLSRPGYFLPKFLKLVHWHGSHCAGQFAARAAFHSQGCFFQIPQVGSLVWIPMWGSIRRPGRLSQPGLFFSNSSSWCTGVDPEH